MSSRSQAFLWVGIRNQEGDAPTAKIRRDLSEQEMKLETRTQIPNLLELESKRGTLPIIEDGQILAALGYFWSIADPGSSIFKKLSSRGRFWRIGFAFGGVMTTEETAELLNGIATALDAGLNGGRKEGYGVCSAGVPVHSGGRRGALYE